MWTYDAVGSGQRAPAAAQGSGQSLLQPLLDNQIVRMHQPGSDEPRGDAVPLETVVSLVKDSMTSAGERDIYVGDTLEVFVMRFDAAAKKAVLVRDDIELRRD